MKRLLSLSSKFDRQGRFRDADALMRLAQTAPAPPLPAPAPIPPPRQVPLPVPPQAPPMPAPPAPPSQPGPAHVQKIIKQYGGTSQQNPDGSWSVIFNDGSQMKVASRRKYAQQDEWDWDQFEDDITNERFNDDPSMDESLDQQEEEPEPSFESLVKPEDHLFGKVTLKALKNIDGSTSVEGMPFFQTVFLNRFRSRARKAIAADIPTLLIAISQRLERAERLKATHDATGAVELSGEPSPECIEYWDYEDDIIYIDIIFNELKNRFPGPYKAHYQPSPFHYIKYCMTNSMRFSKGKATNLIGLLKQIIKG